MVFLLRTQPRRVSSLLCSWFRNGNDDRLGMVNESAAYVSVDGGSLIGQVSTHSTWRWQVTLLRFSPCPTCFCGGHGHVASGGCCGYFFLFSACCSRAPMVPILFSTGL